MPLSSYPIDYQQVSHFSALFNAYIQSNPLLTPFISAFPSWDGFKAQMAEKGISFSPTQRHLLQQRLTSQMEPIGLTNVQQENLAKLTDSGTFSVSCGHQLSLAGGPMYMVFKILTVIKLADELKRQFPDHHFVPVHWLATEDHDLEEILPLRFERKTHQFKVTGTGAVGRLSGNGLKQQMESIPGFPAWMAKCYPDDENLTTATRNWLQKCFGEMGLLVIDGDDSLFKKAFNPLAIKELKEKWSEKDVLEQSQKLKDAGFDPSVHSRDLNLFYLTENDRQRLTKKGDTITTADENRSWQEDEAIAFFEENPEALSPNVLLRPLYSQMLLPDLAFVGGPAEIAYWLQLKSSFETGKTPFPLLIPRFSGCYLDQTFTRRIPKAGIAHTALLKSGVEIRKALFFRQDTTPDLDTAFEKLQAWANETDITLLPAIEAEKKRILKQTLHIQHKIRKATERRHTEQNHHIQILLDEVQPGGGLQERKESWLTFVAQNPGWIQQIYHAINPLDFRFQLLAES